MAIWSPREYQLRAVEFLLQKRYAALFLDMGMGKTSSVLAALSVLKSSGETRRVLLVAPLRVCLTVWEQEGKKWNDFNHLTFGNLANKEEREREKLLAEKHDIYLINPESLKWVLDDRRFGKFNFDTLVIDESTTFKSHDSQRFKALRAKLVHFKRRWILTGTPAPNGFHDLWAQLYVVDQGRSLGDYITHYRAEFFHPSFDGYGWNLNPGARELIYERLKERVMRLDAKDWLEMPELIYNPVSVVLPSEAREAYRSMEDEFLVLLQSELVMSPNTAVAGMRCRQIANGTLYSQDEERRAKGEFHLLHDAKVKAVKEIVESLQGNPCIVFYEFISDAEQLLKAIPGAVNMTAARNPLDVVQRFNQNRIPVLVAHPASAGHGLNLQEGGCHNIVFFTPIWNLEHWQQAIARVYRQGNESERVIVHVIVAKDTLDEHVYKVLSGKEKTQTDLLQALKEVKL